MRFWIFAFLSIASAKPVGQLLGYLYGLGGGAALVVALAGSVFFLWITIQNPLRKAV